MDIQTLQYSLKDQPTFEQSCTSYFTNPNLPSSLNILITMPFPYPPGVLEQLVQFVASTDVFASQFLSQLFQKRLIKVIPNAQVEPLLHIFSAHALKVGSLYTEVYCQLLVRSWQINADSLIPSVSELCSLCESSYTLDQKSGMLYLLKVLVEVFVQTKQLDGYLIQTFKGSCLLRIVETAINVLRSINPQIRELHPVAAVALTTLSTALEYPFTCGFEETDSTVLQIPNSFSSALSSVSLKEKLVALYVPGVHLGALVECLITFASMRENLFMGSTRTNFNEFLSEYGGMLCQRANDEESAHKAGMFLEKVLLTRSVSPMKHLQAALQLVRNLCLNIQEHVTSLYYFLSVFSKWGLRASECEEMLFVRNAVVQAALYVMQGAFEAPQILEEENVEVLFDDLGEMGRVDLKSTVDTLENVVLKCFNEIEAMRTQHIGESGVQHQTEKLAMAMRIIGILINHHIDARTDETQERLDVKMLRIGFNIVNSISKYSAYGLGYGTYQLEQAIMQFFEVVNTVFLNESISSRMEKIVIEVLQVDSVTNLATYMLTKAMSNIQIYQKNVGLVNDSLNIIVRLTQVEKICQIAVKTNFMDSLLRPQVFGIVNNENKNTKRLFFQITCNVASVMNFKSLTALLQMIETTLGIKQNDYETELILYNTFLLSLQSNDKHYLGFLNHVHKQMAGFSQCAIDVLLSFISDLADIKRFHQLYTKPIANTCALILYHDICDAFTVILPKIDREKEDDQVSLLQKSMRAITSMLSSDTIPFGALTLYNDKTHHNVMQYLIGLCLRGGWNQVKVYPKFAKHLFSMLCHIGFVSGDDLFGEHLGEIVTFIFEALKDQAVDVLGVLEQLILYASNRTVLKKVRVLTSPVMDYFGLLVNYSNTIFEIVKILVHNLINNEMDLFMVSKALLPCIVLFPDVYKTVKNTAIAEYNRPALINQAFIDLENDVRSYISGECMDQFFKAAQRFNQIVSNM
ncbi:hypothetical protein EIN_475590 [Entamoeba invadens IP1]|uniref:Exportin-7/Ran-binding protein 17 TPR repeats domain-containing protein n=1 Tax=Entamoeba invadens IP1 TaxID=370355 RepID=A0A0A1U781_ENTIV|nr:hypothetical protein EIN_475590 [Entamoeba invadens IP1]ELP88867.1 hypothetical protein EIN_475590 [Entamoeba invadens IP1]|eukprot:XP_004255638.1 hypothetical protein EIN_475590 [Entamoeba invadens IP1]